ncbi:uncharacterized protein LOC115538275 isoform X1 [Gadus morhua]|uniref:uncharacterized protein LOC115538275 isoform X1 n=1 Tax=Gadus morhua TaxID=8049 RepID=UPI0011B83859|nr:uncharacterized protein LOC115538275 isoform X1 [Gadus morhua]
MQWHFFFLRIFSFSCVSLPAQMSTPAKLRIFLDDHTVHKLLLPSGIPSNLQDLKLVIQSTFSTPDGFTLMYQDVEFGGQFFTLTSMEDVQDMGTLKVVQVEAVILNLSAVEEEDDNLPESDVMSSTSLASQDTVLLSSSSDESPASYRSRPWPRQFDISPFSFEIQLLLEAGNRAYNANGTLLNNPKVTRSVLEKLAEIMFQYTAYPTGIQVMHVFEALAEKYPCLKEPGSFNGMYGWQQRIKYKMANYRAKVRGLQIACPELEVNSSRKMTSRPKGLKRPKKAEVNYLPPLPHGETKETMEEERVVLLTEVKKTNNNKIISEKMEKTFPYRRLEVVNQMPAVPDVMERWPALFYESQVKEEFKRITTINLDRTFLTKMDFY